MNAAAARAIDRVVEEARSEAKKEIDFALKKAGIKTTTTATLTVDFQPPTGQKALLRMLNSIINELTAGDLTQIRRDELEAQKKLLYEKYLESDGRKEDATTELSKPFRGGSSRGSKKKRDNNNNNYTTTRAYDPYRDGDKDYDVDEDEYFQLPSPAKSGEVVSSSKRKRGSSSRSGSGGGPSKRARSQLERRTGEEGITVSNPCFCKKSKCLKLYCECFAARAYCGRTCRCRDCRNNKQNDELRRRTIENVLARRPNAFKPKLISVGDPKEIAAVARGKRNLGKRAGVAHMQGCKCKRTQCRKKYCVCFNAGASCGSWCRCENCLNGKEIMVEVAKKKKAARHEAETKREEDEYSSEQPQQFSSQSSKMGTEGFQLAPAQQPSHE